MIAILILNLMTSLHAKADYQVIAPYFKHDGTFVQGHIRTTPDSNPYNNLNQDSNGFNSGYRPSQPIFPNLNDGYQQDNDGN